MNVPTTQPSPQESIDSTDPIAASQPGRFIPGDAVAFRFGTERWTPQTGEVLCPYSIRMRSGIVHEFTERFRFPVPRPGCDRDHPETVRRVIRLLHLVAGVSYYKAACPPQIEFDTVPNHGDLAFLQRLYVRGLGEYAAVNGVDVRARVAFLSDQEAHEAALGHDPTTTPWSSGLENEFKACRWLVPIGGGKDSFLTVELLRELGAVCTPFVLGTNRVVLQAAQRAAAQVGAEPVIVERMIDPKLLKLNTNGAWNGHVPVTAIVSLAAVVAAVLTGHDAVGMSNERSANAGEVIDQAGDDVNHQHSKSVAFERDLRDRLIDAPVEYVSLLRPFSELSICRAFASRSVHHGAFSSCNGNFKIAPAASETPASRWCNDCPKCRFVCLALAPWLAEASLGRIFGTPPILDPAQLDGYRALLGAPGTAKPYECVGLIDESRAAAELLSKSVSWRESPVSRWYLEHLRPSLPAPTELIREALTPSDEHELPPCLAAAIGHLLSRGINGDTDGAERAPR
jgi:hypothetical protein